MRLLHEILLLIVNVKLLDLSEALVIMQVQLGLRKAALGADALVLLL